MSEQNHPINEVLQTTMSKLREMVDANTVIGQPIVTQEGVTLIPVSRLSFGFATGGSDFGKTPNVGKNFGGGARAGGQGVAGAGLIGKDCNVKLLPVAPPSGDSVSRAVELVPEMFDRITDYIDRKTEEKRTQEDKEG